MTTNLTYNRMRICFGRFDDWQVHPQVVFWGDDNTDCPVCQQMRRVEDVKRQLNKMAFPKAHGVDLNQP